MLDDMNILDQRDSEKTLESGVMQPDQLSMDVTVENPVDANKTITSLVFVGMGGSALAAEFVKTWLDDAIGLPIEIVKTYSLPAHVNENTLAIFSSCSGNTEEVLEALSAAAERGIPRAVIAGGGKLVEAAKDQGISFITLPPIKIQPRMLTFIQVRAIISLLTMYGVLDGQSYLDEMQAAHDWLADEMKAWKKDVPASDNYAKQLAQIAAGKNAVFFGGDISKPLAYKWKISWNENAKNTAFWNAYPEFNHNEFIGWSSHPVEKPFVIFDLISNLEHPRILKRFEISDQLLSGKRPKATVISLRGDTVLKQLCWGHLLADFTSIYVGIVNGVDPGPVPLVERLKKELVK